MLLYRTPFFGLARAGTTAEGATHTLARRCGNGSPPALTVEARNLCRVAAGKSLVGDISVRALPGEVLAVLGRSGAGKSSFLRLLNRLDEPTGGTVLLNGVDYREFAPQELRRRVGMVMQRPYLFPGTVADNIAFGPRQCSRSLDAGEIAALLERVGLSGYQDRDVSDLSGGEAQRVSLARTLANAPQALLLDEPTSALDASSAQVIEELVLGLVRERQMACVLVTHSKSQALNLAARTMVLDAGKQAAYGPTEEVLRDL